MGHLGWFQLPSEDGHEKRYQVHIECLTADDLPRFLSTPESVGRDTPAFARCPKDIPIYLKDHNGKYCPAWLKHRPKRQWRCLVRRWRSTIDNC